MLVTKKVNGQEATAWNELQFIQNKGKTKSRIRGGVFKGPRVTTYSTFLLNSTSPHSKFNQNLNALNSENGFNVFLHLKIVKVCPYQPPASSHYRHTIVEIKGNHYRKCVNVFMNVESSLKLPPFCGIKYSTYTYSLSMFILCETKTVYYITHRYIYIYY